jgi:ribonuclease VapC
VSFESIVIDTSAIVALVEAEPEAVRFERAILNATSRAVASPSLLEAMMVLSRRRGADSESVVMALIRAFDIVVVAFDEELVTTAFAAFLRFGKGRDRAGLNFGDCFSYALARSRQAALLFKGTDFGATDLVAAPW